MPPNVSPQQYSIVTPLTPLLLSPLPPKSQVKKLPQHTYCFKGLGNMKITKKRLIPLLFCILSMASIIRLVKIAKVTSSSSSSLAPTLSQLQNRPPTVHSTANVLAEKEMQFLADIVSNRAPCNLLVFGIEPQYLTLASINAGGSTVFLENERQLDKEFTPTISLLTLKLQAISGHLLTALDPIMNPSSARFMEAFFFPAKTL